MTVIVTALFHPVAGGRDSLVAALRETMPAVHREDGCLRYAIHDAADGTITMIEKWASPQALDAHAAGSAVAALRAAVDPFLAQPTTVTTMVPLEAGDPERGRL